MRLLQKGLKPVYLFARQEPDKDDPDYYPGQKASNIYTKTIYCNVQIADSKITVEAYGERAFHMFQILCENPVQIDKTMLVSLTDHTKPTHKVVSIKPYSSHTTVLVEAI